MSVSPSLHGSVLPAPSSFNAAATAIESLVYSPTFVGTLAGALSVGLQISPLSTYLQIYRQKTTSHYSNVPNVSSLLCNALWILYGVTVPGRMSIVYSSTVNIFINVAVGVLFVAFSVSRRRMLSLYAAMLTLIAITMSTAFVAGEAAGEVFGTVANVADVLMFGAPLSVVAYVIEVKDSACMPGALSLGVTVSATVWTWYGLLLLDIHVWLPSGLGALLGVVQLVVKGVYHKKGKNEAADGMEDIEYVSLSTSGSTVDSLDCKHPSLLTAVMTDSCPTVSTPRDFHRPLMGLFPSGLASDSESESVATSTSDKDPLSPLRKPLMTDFSANIAELSV